MKTKEDRKYIRWQRRGSKLRMERCYRGLSLHRAAKALGISVLYLEDCEAGNADPKALLKEICKW